MTRPIVLFLSGWLAWAGASWAAQPELQDPMRPPMAVQRAIDQRMGVAPADGAAAAHAASGQPRAPGGATPVNGDAGAAAGAAPARSKADVPTSRARVSAVVLADRPGRDAALLDGRIAYVGDKVAGGTVARIDNQGVTVRDPKGRLSLVPLINRSLQPGAAAADAASAPVTPPSGAQAPGKELP